MSQDDYAHIECIKLRMCPFRASRRVRRHHLRRQRHGHEGF